mgnify:FL=1
MFYLNPLSLRDIPLSGGISSLSGRAKSSSSLLTLTNIKNYFDFLAILYPIIAMKMDMSGEMRLKRQYGR